MGVVVSGFEVVKASVGIEVVASVAKRVDAGHRAGRGEHLAPSVVGVGLSTVSLGEKLTLCIVGVSGIRAAAYGRDVAYIVIGVGVAVDAAAVSLAVCQAALCAGVGRSSTYSEIGVLSV